jgi:hypothetical protein
VTLQRESRLLGPGQPSIRGVVLSDSIPSCASFAKEPNSEGPVESPMFLVLFTNGAIQYVVFSFVCIVSSTGH